MATATNAQVQAFVDSRVRPSCMEILQWVYRRQVDKAGLSDIYAALTEQNPTWVDTNSNNAAHTAVPSDVLAWNTFVSNLLTVITGNTTDAPTALSLVQGIQGQWPVVQELLAGPLSQT